MGSADTGAREPQPDFAKARELLTPDEYGTVSFTDLAVWFHQNGHTVLALAESALAAGVGVPPGEARWLWFCSECGACEGDTMQPGCCRSCGSSAEGVRLKARFASDALAGVGEARPAEPQEFAYWSPWHPVSALGHTPSEVRADAEAEA